MQRLGFPHDSRTAQLHDYASVYPQMFARAPRDMTGDELGSTLFAGLALVYGMKPGVLKTLDVGLGPMDGASAVIDLAGGRMWTALPRVGYNGTLPPACEAASRPGSDWASVSLVPYLRDVAWWLHMREPSAASVSFDKVVHRLPWPAIVSLARSVPGWLARCGLPGVLAHVLTGELDYSVHLATSAYINVSEAQIALKHADALERFEALIARACKVGDGPFASALTAGDAPVEPDGDRRFGSRIVPLTARVHEAIRALEGRRSQLRLRGSLDDLVRAWNITAVYSWIRLSWAAAVRPCRDPLVGRGDIDSDGGWIFAQDKHSPFSRESRLVPLPPEEGRLLERLAQDGDRVRLRLHATTQTTLDRLSDDELFFAVLDDQAVPLTPERVRRVLNEEGLGHLFPWPFNAPRHYWLTRALELGTPLEQIEPFLGHLHEPVPWGQLSLVSLQRLSEPMRQLGAAMLKEVGFGVA